MRAFFRWVWLSAKGRPIIFAVALLMMAAGLNLQEIAKAVVTNPSVSEWAGKWWLQYGLAILGFWILAYVFWRQAEAGKTAPEPDTRAAEAYITILSRSVWAKRNARNWQRLPPVACETSKPEALVVEKRLQQQLERAIHNLLAQGKLNAWGHSGAADVETMIPASEWKNIVIGFGERNRLGRAADGGAPHLCAWDQTKTLHSGTRIAYTDVRFSRKQIYSLFPLAWRLRRRHDG